MTGLLSYLNKLNLGLDKGCHIRPNPIPDTLLNNGLKMQKDDNYKHINNDYWVGAVIHINSVVNGFQFISGSWCEGIFRKGTFHEGIWFQGKSYWISGKWKIGAIFVSWTDKNPSHLSPKVFRKPKLTLSLNFAKYQ